MLDVCSGWAAAIEAAPELWPTATLALPPTELNELEQGDRNVRAARSVMEGFAYARMCASDQDEEAAWSMMERAAMLSPRCRRVRIEGDERVKVSMGSDVCGMLCKQLLFTCHCLTGPFLLPCSAICCNKIFPSCQCCRPVFATWSCASPAPARCPLPCCAFGSCSRSACALVA